MKYIITSRKIYNLGSQKIKWSHFLSLFLFLFSIPTIETSFSQTIKKEYYDPWTKSSLMAEYQINNAGEKHGWFKGYDQEGVLVYEYNFKNNLWDGINKEYGTYRGTRELLQTETYSKGILNGPAKYYGTLNGKEIVLKEGDYLNGEKQGKWLILTPYTNWELSDEQKKGASYIKTFNFFEKGIETQPDREDIGLYYPSGKICYSVNYKSGVKIGEYKSYYPTGSIERDASYDESGKVLFVKEYYPDGKLKYHEDLRGNDFIYFEYDKNGNETTKSLTIKSNRQRKVNQNKEREKLASTLMKRADSLANDKKYFEALNLLENNYKFIKVNALSQEGITDDLILSSGYHDKYIFYFNKVDSINNDNNQKMLEINHLTEILWLISKNEDYTKLAFEQYKNNFIDFWSQKMFFDREGVYCNKENFYTVTNSQFKGSCFERALRNSFYYDEAKYNEFRRIENFINQVYPLARNKSNIYFNKELDEIYNICLRAWGFYKGHISADEFFILLNQSHNALNSLVKNVMIREKLTSEINIIINGVEERLLTKPSNKDALNKSLILAKIAFQEKDKLMVSESIIRLSDIKIVLEYLIDEKNSQDKIMIKNISKAESLEQIKSILKI